MAWKYLCALFVIVRVDWNIRRGMKKTKKHIDNLKKNEVEDNWNGLSYSWKMNNLKHFMNYYMGFGKWIDKLCWAGFGKKGMLLAGLLPLAVSPCPLPKKPRAPSPAESRKPMPRRAVRIRTSRRGWRSWGGAWRTPRRGAGSGEGWGGTPLAMTRSWGFFSRSPS